MKKLLQLIKKAAVEAIESRKPCDVLFATVKSTAPVTVNLENNAVLPENLLIFTSDLKYRLSVGNKVILIRKTGGQQYLVAGVVV